MKCCLLPWGCPANETESELLEEDKEARLDWEETAMLPWKTFSFFQQWHPSSWCANIWWEKFKDGIWWLGFSNADRLTCWPTLDVQEVVFLAKLGKISNEPAEMLWSPWQDWGYWVSTGLGLLFFLIPVLYLYDSIIISLHRFWALWGMGAPSNFRGKDRIAMGGLGRRNSLLWRQLWPVGSLKVRNRGEVWELFNVFVILIYVRHWWNNLVSRILVSSCVKKKKYSCRFYCLCVLCVPAHRVHVCLFKPL